MNKKIKYAQEIAKIIKKVRLEKKLTLDSLAKEICCVSYLNKVENGKIEIRYIMAKILFERLGLDLEATLNELETN